MQAPSTPATSYTASLRNCVTESLNAKGGNDQDSAYGEGHSLIDNPYALFLRDSSLADSDHAYSSGLTSSGSSLVSESYAAASSTSTDYQPWSSDDQHEVAPSHSYALFTSLSSEPTTNAASSSSDPVPQTSLSKEPPVVVDGSKIERDWTREFNEIAAQVRHSTLCTAMPHAIPPVSPLMRLRFATWTLAYSRCRRSTPRAL